MLPLGPVEADEGVEPSTTSSLLVPGVGAGEGVWEGAEVGSLVAGPRAVAVHTVSAVVAQAVSTLVPHVELAEQIVHGA